MVYDRTHTRDMAELAALISGKTCRARPSRSSLATAASMGLPGFSGFVAEISVVIGTWESRPWLLVPVAVGHPDYRRLFPARPQPRVFTRRECQCTGQPEQSSAMPPLTPAEIAAISLLLLASLAIGIFPEPWLSLIDDGLRSPLFQSFLLHP